MRDTFTTALSIGLLCLLGCATVPAPQQRQATPARGEEGLKALAELAPEYSGYSVDTVSLPVTAPDICLEVVCRVASFVRTAPAGSGGVHIGPNTEVGAVTLNDKEKEEAAGKFNQAVHAAISRQFTLNPDSALCLVVVSGTGGGMMIGYGGFIESKIFLLDTEAKTLLAYSDEPMGKGNDVDAALEDLAAEVNRAFLKMAKQNR
jgi:hypothetical protein